MLGGFDIDLTDNSSSNVQKFLISMQQKKRSILRVLWTGPGASAAEAKKIASPMIQIVAVEQNWLSYLCAFRKNTNDNLHILQGDVLSCNFHGSTFDVMYSTAVVNPAFYERWFELGLAVHAEYFISFAEYYSNLPPLKALYERQANDAHFVRSISVKLRQSRESRRLFVLAAGKKWKDEVHR